MKKRLTILFLTICILFQTFGIQIGDYFAPVTGHANFKKSSTASQPSSLKYFLASEENEENAEDEKGDSDEFHPQISLHFSNLFSFLNTTFNSKINKNFLFSTLTHKTHKFLIFRNLRI